MDAGPIFSGSREPPDQNNPSAFRCLGPRHLRSGEFAGELVKNPEGVTCQFKW